MRAPRFAPDQVVVAGTSYRMYQVRTPPPPAPFVPVPYPDITR